MIYNNYHKHTMYSSAIVPDTNIKMEEYFKRAVELGHKNYFTTEHGFAGSVFEALKLGKKYGINVLFGMEGYIVKDNKEKDRSNLHFVVIAKSNKSRRQINLLNSLAHENGYYYTARWSLEDVLKLDPSDVYITTACCAGVLKTDESIEEIFKPMAEHFGQNMFLETQNHMHEIQVVHNKKVLNLAEEYGLKLIHGNDSHYVYKQQGKDRLEYLQGKGITYDDEDSFVLDYPTYDEIVERYLNQGVLTKDQIVEAINNTLEFDNCAQIDIDDSIKMPNPYMELAPKERYDKLESMIYDLWERERPNVDQSKIKEYEDGIRFELDIVKDTNDVVHTADYFLLNSKIVKNAQEKYNGHLTTTGRGSAPSFYLNRLLGMTSIDRFALNVPIFPTRFLSTSRLLGSRKLPDIDYNVSDPEPFVKATKDELGENGCHWMIAYGTMQESEAFRNICRNDKLDFDYYNNVAKDIDAYKDIPEWKDRIERSKRQVGSIVSVSRHPCANIIMDCDIREEIGLIRSGKDLVAVITSVEADDWKYLKNDYLTVTVVKILNKVAEKIGIKLPEVNDLIKILDDKVWDIYEKGLTATLDQTSTENGKRLVMRYKPRSYEELSAWVAAIRPGFASLLEKFLTRQSHTNGVDEMDELLIESQKYLLYQESTMAFLVWLGIPEDETYTIVSNISKKKYLKPEYKQELIDLKSNLKRGWIEKVGEEKGFEESWKVVEDSSAYAFNCSHSVSTAINSIYGAYQKSHYPMEYYSVVLDENENNIPMTSRLVEEMKYFNIELKPARFRYSSGDYMPNKEDNSIYKGIGSIKGINSEAGNQLYNLKDLEFDSFTDFMSLIKPPSTGMENILLSKMVERDFGKININSRQLMSLIKLDFFSEFGKAKKLEYIADMYYKYHNKKTAKKADLPFDEDMIRRHSEKETEKQFSKVDFVSIVKECEKLLEDEDYTLKEKIQFQKEYLGYVNLTDSSLSKRIVLVNDLNTKYSPKANFYCLNNGKSETMKIKRKPKRRQPNITYFEDKPFKEGDIIYAKKIERKRRMKKVDDEWVYMDEWDFWITQYDLVEQ